LVRERTQVSGTLSRFASSVESITSDWLISNYQLRRNSSSEIAMPCN
jgi:hypothetical protein